MSNKDIYRLQHMIDAAREILAFLDGKSRSDLESDRKLALSLVALYQILGEAAKNVSSDFRAAHKDIEWSQIARMRDRIAHGYFDVDLDILWDTAGSKLPALLDRLEPLIDQLKLDLGG